MQCIFIFTCLTTSQCFLEFELLVIGNMGNLDFEQRLARNNTKAENQLNERLLFVVSLVALRIAIKLPYRLLLLYDIGYI